MKVSCWQHHFLLLRSSLARQAGYAGALGGYYVQISSDSL
jgi:hypothetical protein